MSRLHRIARTILATLPDATVEKLARAYTADPTQIRELEGLFQRVPHADTVVEWALLLQSMDQITLPEDAPRVAGLATFFFANRGTQKFRDVVAQMPWSGTIPNPRNLLDFSILALQRVQDFFADSRTKVEIERVNRLGQLLPGAELIYDKNGVQVVKVTEVEAACDLARGSKWCTSDPQTAARYLDSGPLYVIYEKGKKKAQMHLESNRIQLMDLQDQKIPIDLPIARMLVALGVWYKVLTSALIVGINAPLSRNIFLDYYKYEVEIDGDHEFKDHIKNSAVYSFGFSLATNSPFPEGEDAIATKADYSYVYAKDILHKRFPKGEAAIARSAEYSYAYARDVLHDRFLLGE